MGIDRFSDEQIAMHEDAMTDLIATMAIKGELKGGLDDESLDDAAKKAIEMAIDDTNEVLSAQGLVVAAMQAGDFSVVSGAVEVPDTPDR